jgi:hypothetical protein
MKRTFKQWLFYKFKKTVVYVKRRRRNIIKTLDAKQRPELSEIQKPLFSICLKLIGDSNTELRSNSIDYTYHIENDNYLLIIRPGGSTESDCSVSLIEYKRSESSVPAFVDMPIPSEYVKIIINRFEKEVQRRMKNRQVLKTHKVANHLQSILKEMERN